MCVKKHTVSCPYFLLHLFLDNGVWFEFYQTKGCMFQVWPVCHHSMQTGAQSERQKHVLALTKQKHLRITSHTLPPPVFSPCLFWLHHVLPRFCLLPVLSLSSSWDNNVLAFSCRTAYDWKFSSLEWHPVYLTVLKVSVLVGILVGFSARVSKVGVV